MSVSERFLPRGRTVSVRDHPGTAIDSWRLAPLMALAAVAIMVTLVWATMQARPGGLTIGSYRDWNSIDGFYRVERAGTGELMRWSSDRAEIRLPALAGRAMSTVAVWLDGVRPPESAPPMVRVSAGAQHIAFPALPGKRRYEFLSQPRSATEPFTINVQSDTFRPEGHAYDLGVAVFGATIQPIRQHVSGDLLAWALTFVVAVTVAAGAVSRSVGFATAIATTALLAFVLLSWRHTVALWLPHAVFVACVVAALAHLLRRTGARSRLNSAVLLTLILLVAAGLRAFNLNWDDGAGFHVDEAVISRVALDLQPPYNPKFFSYGSLPIYLYRATGSLLSVFDDRWLTPRVFPLIGRTYSVLAGTFTVFLTALMGARLGGRRLGLLAAVLLAFTVLAIQAAHFGTTDTLLTLVAMTLAWASLNILDHGRARDFMVAGAMLGFGIAIKITAVTLGLLPALAVGLRLLAIGSGIINESGSTRGGLLRSTVAKIGVAALAAVVACAIGSPYYFLDASSWIAALRMESDDASTGMADYTRQFIGTPVYLYVIQNFPWTLGWPLTVAGLAGLVLATIAHVRNWRSPVALRWLILLGWAIGYFAFFGRFHTKYIRYMLPIAPVLALSAAWAILWLRRLPLGHVWSAALSMGVVGSTGLYALAFVNGVYAEPDARLQASHWIRANVPSGTALTREQYDVRLPVQETSDRTLGDQPWYPLESLQWYAEDTPEKARQIVEQLSRAEYMVIASRSVYRPSLDHPDLFAMNARFFQDVFDGTSGFREVARWQPVPHLGPLRWERPAPEETFEVFDHPTVIIYERSPEFDPRALEQALLSEVAQ